MNDMANWQSVIAWGKFEEVMDEDERKWGLKLLLNRTLPVISSITTHLGEHWPFSSDDFSDIKGIVVRILLTEKTGRFETSHLLNKSAANYQ